MLFQSYICKLIKSAVVPGEVSMGVAKAGHEGATATLDDSHPSRSSEAPLPSEHCPHGQFILLFDASFVAKKFAGGN